MGLRRIAFETIDRSSLARSEGDPVLRVLLERAKELLAASFRGLVEFVPALELALKCKFADEAAHMLRAAGTTAMARRPVGGDLR